jgi:phage shock protein PspC (stress-responsive transcriptional regulator)
MAGEYRAPDWFSSFVKDVERVFTMPKGRGKLIRPRYPRVIAGVCSGIAEYFGWDVAVLRVLVVVFTVATSGFLILGYGLGWVLIPEGSYALPGDVGASKS